MPADPSTASERPLVVRFGALGDMVVLTALLRSLSRRWGAPCDVVGGGGAPRQVFQGLDSVGEVITLPSRRRPYPLAPPQWRLVRWLRRRPPSPTYIVEGERGALPKLGWLLDRGGVPRDHRLSGDELPRQPLEHNLDYHRRWAAAVPPAYAGRALPPPPAPAPEPELAVTAGERRDCRAWLAGHGWLGSPLVLIQTESRRRNRGRWPRRSWVETVRAVLTELPAAQVLLLGAPDEAPAVELLRRDCADPRVHNVARELGLRRLFALAGEAHSCISLDTGPAHVVAVFGCPLVVLPGMADPRRNRPAGPADRVRVVATAPRTEWPGDPWSWQRWHDIERIPVAAVVEAWKRVLDSAAK